MNEQEVVVRVDVLRSIWHAARAVEDCLDGGEGTVDLWRIQDAVEAIAKEHPDLNLPRRIDRRKPKKAEEKEESK